MNLSRLKLAALGAALALGLAACGGGDSGPAFSSLVSFGDSVSDVGTYKVGTIAAVGGGRWTVNSPQARTWTEIVASELGTSAPCAAQTGLLPNVPGFQGAAVTDFPACRNYAQGGARISSPFASNAAALQAAPFNQANIGLLAKPVTQQMNTHLANVGGSYSGSELVTVFAGGNDLFMHANGVEAAPGGGTGAVGAAIAAGWPQDVQQIVAGGGPAAVNAAVTAGVSGMGQAGAELAALIKSQVLAKGARQVVVLNLPDVSLTPYALSLDATSRGLIHTMVTTFNSQLQAGLAGTEVLLADAYAQSREQAANPARFGISNATMPACSMTSPANPLPGGSSLACTTASTVAPDTSGYLYADSVHPAPLSNQLTAQFVAARMRAAGWL